MDPQRARVYEMIFLRLVPIIVKALLALLLFILIILMIFQILPPRTLDMFVFLMAIALLAAIDVGSLINRLNGLEEDEDDERSALEEVKGVIEDVSLVAMVLTWGIVAYCIGCWLQGRTLR